MNILVDQIETNPLPTPPGKLATHQFKVVTPPGGRGFPAPYRPDRWLGKFFDHAFFAFFNIFFGSPGPKKKRDEMSPATLLLLAKLAFCYTVNLPSRRFGLHLCAHRFACMGGWPLPFVGLPPSWLQPTARGGCRKSGCCFLKKGFIIKTPDQYFRQPELRLSSLFPPPPGHTLSYTPDHPSCKKVHRVCPLQLRVLFPPPTPTIS